MKGQTAVPETQDEFRELLEDHDRLNAALEDGTFPDLVTDYVAKFTAKQADMVTRFDEQMQVAWQNMARANPGLIKGFRPGGNPEPGNRHERRAAAVRRSRLANAENLARDQHLWNEAAQGAQFDDEPYSESIRSYMYALWKAEHVAKDAGDTDTVARIVDYKKRLANGLGRPKNAGMSERLPAEGGFLVPEHLRSEILMIALETAAVRPRARIIPMDSLRVPMPTIDDISHANNVYGGVTAFWTEEGGTLSASAPSFGEFALQAKKLTAYTTIPNELLQDSITPLDTWFNMFFPRAYSWFEDVAFISGTGTGEPQGLLNAPCAVRQPVGSAHEILWSDIANMYARVWPASLNSAVWLCAPDAIGQLLQLSLSSSVAPPLFLQGFQALGTPGNRDSTGYQYTLMGRPLIVTEKMPASGSSNTTLPGALTLWDPDYYLIGDRQAMQIATSSEYLFASDLVAYRVIGRVDGRTWLQSAITPENGGSTLSVTVKLDTTATS